MWQAYWWHTNVRTTLTVYILTMDSSSNAFDLLEVGYAVYGILLSFNHHCISLLLIEHFRSLLHAKLCKLRSRALSKKPSQATVQRLRNLKRHRHPPLRTLHWKILGKQSMKLRSKVGGLSLLKRVKRPKSNVCNGKQSAPLNAKKQQDAKQLVSLMNQLRLFQTQNQKFGKVLKRLPPRQRQRALREYSSMSKQKFLNKSVSS